MNEIESALQTIKRVTALTYGRHALAGEDEMASNLATLYRMAVAGLELCGAMRDGEGVG